MADVRETTTNYIAGDKTFSLYSSEYKWINKIAKLHEKYPDEVKYTYINEDGSFIAQIPTKWFKVSPPRKVSDEFKQAASERLKAARNNQNDLD